MSASRIAPKLYQGSVPPYGPDLRDRGFHTLVLCAIEWQPASRLFPGVTVLRCPYDDTSEPLERSTLQNVIATAHAVASGVRRGERTLVTCQKGWNRSGLVTGIALTVLYGCSGSEAVEWVRSERDRALSNKRFVEYLRRIPARAPVIVQARSPSW